MTLKVRFRWNRWKRSDPQNPWIYGFIHESHESARRASRSARAGSPYVIEFEKDNKLDRVNSQFVEEMIEVSEEEYLASLVVNS